MKKSDDDWTFDRLWMTLAVPLLLLVIVAAARWL